MRRREDPDAHVPPLAAGCRLPRPDSHCRFRSRFCRTGLRRRCADRHRRRSIGTAAAARLRARARRVRRRVGERIFRRGRRVSPRDGARRVPRRSGAERLRNGVGSMRIRCRAPCSHCPAGRARPGNGCGHGDPYRNAFGSGRRRCHDVHCRGSRAPPGADGRGSAPKHPGRDDRSRRRDRCGDVALRPRWRKQSQQGAARRHPLERTWRHVQLQQRDNGRSRARRDRPRRAVGALRVGRDGERRSAVHEARRFGGAAARRRFNRRRHVRHGERRRVGVRKIPAPFAIIVAARTILFSRIPSMASSSDATSDSEPSTSPASPNRATRLYRNSRTGSAVEYGTITTPLAKASAWARRTTA